MWAGCGSKATVATQEKRHRARNGTRASPSGPLSCLRGRSHALRELPDGPPHAPHSLERGPRRRAVSPALGSPGRREAPEQPGSALVALPRTSGRGGATPDGVHAGDARQHTRRLDTLAERRRVLEAALLAAEDNGLLGEEARRDDLHGLILVVGLERVPVHGQQVLHQNFHGIVQKHHGQLAAVQILPNLGVREKIDYSSNVEPAGSVQPIFGGGKIVAKKGVSILRSSFADKVCPDN